VVSEVLWTVRDSEQIESILSHPSLIGYSWYMAVAQRYRDFAEQEARGHSSVYESWAVALSDSPQALALIASLPTTSPASEDRTRLSEYRSTGCPVGVEPNRRSSTK